VWEVRCGSDDDAGKHTRWAQVKEAYPRAEASVRERSPAGAKDWNDALPALLERAEGPGQGQEDDRAPGRGRGPGGRDEHGRD